MEKIFEESVLVGVYEVTQFVQHNVYCGCLAHYDDALYILYVRCWIDDELGDWTADIYLQKTLEFKSDKASALRRTIQLSDEYQYLVRERIPKEKDQATTDSR